MKLIKFPILIFFLLLFSACKGEIMSSYDESAIAIQNINRTTTDSIKIYYSVMSETLYYCPGANITEESNNMYIEFIRCHIDKKCIVTHPVNTDDIGSFILVKNGNKSIYIKWEDRNMPISPISE